jgi:hypothetical protein
MSKVLGVRLDKETLNLLEEKASKEGKNKSKILKELIVNYLAESGSGSKPSQNDIKVDGFVEKKPVNTSSGYVAKTGVEEQPKLSYVNCEFDHSTKTKSTRDFLRIFTIITLIGGVVAIGYFAYKTYVNRSKKEHEWVTRESSYTLSPQALSYILT